MTPEQELAAFEAWAMYKADLQKGSAGEYVDIFARVMLDAWQAALASPEAQALSKDAERLDFMISEECQIQSLSTPNEVRHRLYWPDADEAQCEWSVNPRAAIDAAMEKQNHD